MIETTNRQTNKPYFYLRTREGFKEKELIRQFVDFMPHGMYNIKNKQGNTILISAHTLSTARRRVENVEIDYFNSKDYPNILIDEQIRFFGFTKDIEDERNRRRNQNKPKLNYGVGTTKLIFEIVETISENRQRMIDKFLSLSEEEIYKLKLSAYLIQKDNNNPTIQNLSRDEAIACQNLKFNLKTKSGYYFVWTFIQDNLDDIALLTVYLKNDSIPKNTISLD
tara:strand:+ start:1425 stop:2096 length:672 start_codon:yes stop_codon:yes gene_type:complete